jgi:hypothetical protein
MLIGLSNPSGIQFELDDTLNVQDDLLIFFSDSSIYLRPIAINAIKRDD